MSKRKIPRNRKASGVFLRKIFIKFLFYGFKKYQNSCPWHTIYLSSHSLKRALKEKESWNSTPILSDPEFTYHLPVLCLQDIGDITMDLQAVSEGRDDYLCYPAPDTDRFNIPFNECLERYIVCQGFRCQNGAKK